MAIFSVQGRFIFLLAAIVVGCVVASVFLALYLADWLLVLPLVVILTFVAVIAAVKLYFRPMNATLLALRSGVDRFRDHDYSVTIANRQNDALGQLVDVYNDLARILREERFSLFQRELLLDTVIQSSAVAVVIENASGAIVYSNREAQDVLQSDHALEGQNLMQACAVRSAVLAEALQHEDDGLFSLADGDVSEVYHLTCRRFTLNAQVHRLFLLKKLTREIARQEVETWKKVIRVITHEMNNSLAPIRSLMSSARKIVASGTATDKLQDIFGSIDNRTRHLQSFIEQYAQFSRLPRPRIEQVEWRQFIDSLRQLVAFELADDLPLTPAWFDAAQMEQVLINLLKNALEAGSPPEQVKLRVLQNSREVLIAVEDRGQGMNADQLQLALLPFYSTKRTGTGLGLPLCREIIEAHNGSLNLFNREGGGLAATCKLPLGQHALNP